jgi:uncharacterized ferritin-like protein (DUF455 family)
MSHTQPTSLFDTAEACLQAADIDAKLQLSADTRSRWLAGELVLQPQGEPASIGEPGRPGRPLLVSGRKVPARSLHTAEGRAAFIHALAHIEFNAINLGWDAVYRFRGMPRQYYDDWSRVAAEEAAHFQLLRKQLRMAGYDYGDFDAHNGLWEMAQKTAHDPLVRMALVPRVLEARGLDVAPGMIERFRDMNDSKMVEVMDLILREEVGHVEIGSHWFAFLCLQRDLDPELTYRQLFEQYMQSQIKGPLNQAARLSAGFTQQEIDYLDGLIR